VPEPRRSPLALMSATSTPESWAPGPDHPTGRESSPPEGTPTRNASQSQVMQKADAHAAEPAAARLAGEAGAGEAAAGDAGPGLAPLIGTLAHDLNNLLQIISTTTQLLRLREQNTESQLFLSDIASATDRAAGIAGQMLDAARLERRRPTEPNLEG
jgi:signal transduction histidine kinase